MASHLAWVNTHRPRLHKEQTGEETVLLSMTHTEVTTGFATTTTTTIGSTFDVLEVGVIVGDSQL